MHPSEEPESPFSSVPNIVTEETPTARRLQTQKRLFLYTNLILLHRPYVSDILSKRNTNNRPSYDICSYAAIIITDLASKLDTSDLSYHSTLPILAYALIMAVRIHIMNASSSNPEKFNAKRNFDLSICILSKLPQSRDTTSMLYDSIQALEYKYHHRYTGLS
ncbi:hypothetical protein BDF20DRAFT_812687, partial [Mycotypha africana]|uniref:uncharacterized protein n=1 Tax=Mycotypha africana TaxID=64632 RepID=UPI002300E8DF